MKTKTLQVRIEPDNINAMKLRAEDLGLSVSEYVRYLFKMDMNQSESIEQMMKHARAIDLTVRSLTPKMRVKS